MKWNLTLCLYKKSLKTDQRPKIYDIDELLDRSIVETLWNIGMDKDFLENAPEEHVVK